MAESSSLGNEDLYTSMEKLDELDAIKSNSELIKGSITRYILNTKTLIDGERLRRETFGEKDKRKPHKTILMVGETGTGKSTLINAFINYMLGVKWENRIWCEIILTKEDQDQSQTKAVTVYDVFVKGSSFSLTVIDTPGFGSTEGKKFDLSVTETLHELFRSADGVEEVDAVCLVVSSNTTRLTEGQLYVFDAILSLFGVDIKKNIVVLITHAPKKPTNALKAIKQSKVKCAKKSDGEPIYFCFDNSHCEDFNEEDEDNKSWVKNGENMKNFFDFLNDIKTSTLQLTASVLTKRKYLQAAISNFKDKITMIELRKKEVEQTKEALEQHEKEKEDINNFEYEVDEPYKEKVPIEPKWWHLSTEATCCSVCEENCHYPGCWWVRDLSWCSVMSNGKCTVCTGRCDHTQHVKERKIYVAKTRRVKKTYEDLKKKYAEKSGKKTSLKSTLDIEIKEHEQETTRLLDECYNHVETLNLIALNTDSMLTLEILDFLIEKMKEMKNTERVHELKELKNRAQKVCLD